MAQDTHVPGFDVLRVAAAYSVIIIHLAFAPNRWLIVIHTAVPLFALLAGYFAGIAKRTRSPVLGEGVTQRARRLLVPYLFWSAVYWVLNNLLFDCLIADKAFVWPDAFGWFQVVVLGGAGPHLWFLPCLFLGQVLLLVATRGCERTRLPYDFFLVMLFFTSLGACLKLPGNSSATLLGFGKIYFFRLFLFLVLGELFARYAVLVRSKVSRVRSFKWSMLAFSALGWVLWGCGWLDGLIVPPLIIVSGLFWWALAEGWERAPPVGGGAGRYGGWIARAAQASMGVYLVHVVLTSPLNVVGKRVGLAPFSVGLTLAFAVLVFLGSMACVMVADRIPFMRRVVV